MSVEASQIRKGQKIRLENGRVLVVRGSFLSTEGIVITAREGQAQFDWSIPLKDIKEIIENV